jgi:hypothetical protein
MLTSSSLYLQEGEYFAEAKFIAADGGFEGDGRFKCSHKNPGNNPVKIILNLTWREVHNGVENKYQRVGAWFPLLGNNKRNWRNLKSCCCWQFMLQSGCITLFQALKTCLMQLTSHLRWSIMHTFNNLKDLSFKSKPLLKVF